MERGAKATRPEGSSARAGGFGANPAKPSWRPPRWCEAWWPAADAAAVGFGTYGQNGFRDRLTWSCPEPSMCIEAGTGATAAARSWSRWFRQHSVAPKMPWDLAKTWWRPRHGFRISLAPHRPADGARPRIAVQHPRGSAGKSVRRV